MDPPPTIQYGRNFKIELMSRAINIISLSTTYMYLFGSMENKPPYSIFQYSTYNYICIHKRYIKTVVQCSCFPGNAMMLKTLGLFLLLLLLPAPLHCKLILSTNPSKPVQNEGSQAEIVNSSLQRFDSFTLCARYGIAS